MKHPHHDLIVEWAKDTSRVVQYRMQEHMDWDITSTPSWIPGYQYRFKPEPKPDVMHEYVCDIYKQRIPEHYEKPNLRLTFDGETGKLKSVEMLK